MVQFTSPPQEEILAVYGTLAPGQPNHGVLEPFGGRWSRARVRGTVGQDRGYPVFIYDPMAPELEVDILESPRINWRALDEFEGENYRRILVPLRQGEKRFTGYIYAWANPLHAGALGK